ncbi:MAG: FkbM family methyltransferase [Halieaceae bacterium]
MSKMRKLGKIRRGEIDEPWLKLGFAEVVVDEVPLRYAATNRLAVKRVETLHSKEPTTIPWLDMIQSDDVFVDIGANIGMYTAYAGKVRGARVYAFEPEALNFAELNKNIFINDLHGKVLAYCMALGNEVSVDRLLLGGFAEGLSHHDFAENTWLEDKDFGALQTSIDQRLEQGCVSFPLDALVEQGAVPVPKFVKIDVDGLEHKVVEGSWKTFQRGEVESILIEIDHRLPHCVEIIDRMVEIGWRYSIDQLRTNRKTVFSVEQVESMRKTGKGGFNYIFYKDKKYDELFNSFLTDYEPPLAKK